MVDDSFASGIDKKYPVAAQIEVIYWLSQTFRRQRVDAVDVMDGNSDGNGDEDVSAKDSNVVPVVDGSSDSDSANENDTSSAEEKKEDEGEKFDTVWIAVFEGMLSSGGDVSDGSSEDSLRWKLIDNRPAHIDFKSLDPL